VRGQKPDVTFDSAALGQILAAIVAGGNNYCLDLSAGNTDLEYRRGQNVGIRYDASAAQHERLRMSKGFLYWNTIRADHQQDASISCRLVGVYDGTNAPLVQVGTGTLTGTPAATQFYTLGPVKVNGAALNNEQSISLDSGAQPEEAGGSGDVWDTYCGIKQTDDVLTVSALGKPFGNLGLTGTILSELLIYLRAKTADGHNVPDGTASHIKISATNGLVLPENVGGAANDPATSSLRIRLRAPSGSAAPLTISTASAIT